VAESCTICSSRSRRPVRELLDTPSYSSTCYYICLRVSCRDICNIKTFHNVELTSRTTLWLSEKLYWTSLSLIYVLICLYITYPVRPHLRPSETDKLWIFKIIEGGVVFVWRTPLWTSAYAHVRLWICMFSALYVYARFYICTCPDVYGNVRPCICMCSALYMHMSGSAYAHVRLYIWRCPARVVHIVMAWVSVLLSDLRWRFQAFRTIHWCPHRIGVQLMKLRFTSPDTPIHRRQMSLALISYTVTNVIQALCKISTRHWLNNVITLSVSASLLMFFSALSFIWLCYVYCSLFFLILVSFSAYTLPYRVGKWQKRVLLIETDGKGRPNGS
jgi:hypothetical protein